MPSTGSIRCAMPGSSRPAEPTRLCMGVFSASTGAVSVAP